MLVINLKEEKMDIRTLNKEEKDKYIDEVKIIFDKIRHHMRVWEEDMESEDLITQTSSVWISGQLCRWFDDFLGQIKNLHKQKSNVTDLQNEIMEAVNDSGSDQQHH